MSFAIQMHEKADEELADTFSWYENQKEGLGDQFLSEFRKMTSLLESNPLLFQTRFKNYRAAILDAFPYLLVFEIEEDAVIIYSVFHTSRNPKIWKKRVVKSK